MSLTTTQVRLLGSIAVIYVCMSASFCWQMLLDQQAVTAIAVHRAPVFVVVAGAVPHVLLQQVRMQRGVAALLGVLEVEVLRLVQRAGRRQHPPSLNCACTEHRKGLGRTKLFTGHVPHTCQHAAKVRVWGHCLMVRGQRS